jgi:hypothetical protein
MPGLRDRDQSESDREAISSQPNVQNRWKEESFVIAESFMHHD